MAPISLDEMLEKYSPKEDVGHSRSENERQNERVPSAPEEIEVYWEKSIYRKDQEVLEMFCQTRAETVTETDGLALLQAIVARRGLKELTEVIRDGFERVCKILEEGKEDKENDG